MSADLLARGIGARAHAIARRHARETAMRAAAAMPIGPLPCFTVAASPPLITTTDAAAPTISSAVRVTATNACFRVTGTPIVPVAADPSTFGASDGAGGTGFTRPIQWEWMSDAAQVELLVLKHNALFDLFVDGQLVQDGAFATPTTGDRRLVKLDWSATGDPRRPRHYRLAGINLLFGGLYLDPAGSAWFPGGSARRGLIAIVGDSYSQGTGAPSVARTWAAAAAAQLQMDAWSDGVGGAGWNSGGANVPASRVAKGVAALTRAPDLLVTAMGYNDFAADAPALVGLRARYDACVAAMRSAWPAARIVTLGPWTPLGPTTALGRVKAALVEAAAANGAAFLDIENFVGVGNRGIYTAPDNVHPTAAGHLYLGRRIGQAIAEALA
ncbi:SGNH/GDSL hydrolase family protein [Sphingomonas sp. ACRSK]|uniref:SGNH/GDSL hydrolase family protein n=1 Tax=Sphingomonas sp. ACRSK TaxID=2918213 RepID=UPI001EF5C768|nr:SGNH/GDSL hydrolase family protein [Sphingomonas sp. ACRSK]MCG7348565.1 SGNH/GDSL hydrolase family protein [Sphingomonas sp. ACRSK]